MILMKDGRWGWMVGSAPVLKAPLEAFFEKKYFRFDQVRSPQLERVRTWDLIHCTPRLEVYKKGRRTIRSIRTRSVRKIEIEMRQGALPYSL